jgi:hypothetical protein
MYTVCTCIVGDRNTRDRSAVARYLSGPLWLSGDNSECSTDVGYYYFVCIIRSSNSNRRRHSWKSGKLVGDSNEGDRYVTVCHASVNVNVNTNVKRKVFVE